jgi:hypothetical protein
VPVGVDAVRHRLGDMARRFLYRCRASPFPVN